MTATVAAGRSAPGVFPRVVLAAGLAAGPSLAAADPLGWPDTVGARHLWTIRNLSGMRQDAMELQVHPQHWRGRWMGMDLEGRAEIAFGVFRVDHDQNGFASVGPAVQWQRPLGIAPLFLDLGISPTVLAETEFKEGTDLGSNFHFTSHAALGVAFGARRGLEVAYRIQHTSNSNVDANNPGVDFHGITARWRFR